MIWVSTGLTLSICHTNSKNLGKKTANIGRLFMSRKACEDTKWVYIMVLALLSAGVDSFLLERLPLSFYSRSTAVAGTYRTSCRVPHCQKTPFLSPSVAHPLNFCSRRKHAGSRNAAIGGDGVAEGGERKLMSASVFDEWVQRRKHKNGSYVYLNIIIQ